MPYIYFKHSPCLSFQVPLHGTVVRTAGRRQPLRRRPLCHFGFPFGALGAVDHRGLHVVQADSCCGRGRIRSSGQGQGHSGTEGEGLMLPPDPARGLSI